MVKTSVKQDTLKGVKWTALERIALQGIQFVIGIILARLLDPTDFGVVGMMTVFIVISNTFVDGGFSNALIRKLDCSENDYSTAFYFNFIVGLCCYIVLFFCSPFIAVFFNTPILTYLLKVFALTLFINSLGVVQIARLTRDINFKSQAKATIIGVLISGTFGIYLAYSGYGVWSLVWQQVLNAGIKVLIIWIEAKWVPSFKFSRKSFKELFGFGGKILLSNLIGNVYSQMNTIAIGKFYTPQDLGFYTRGQQFAHMPTSAITDVLGKVTFPVLSKIQKDDIRLVGVYRKYISMTSLVIFFLLTLLAAISKPFILILLSDKWLDSVIFLQLYCLTFMFEHITKLNLNLLQVKGRSDLYLRLEIIKKIIAIILLLIAIPFGVLAICISALLYSQIALVINTYYTGKLFDLGYFKQVSDFIKYLLLSIATCLIAYMITFTTIQPMFQILIGVLLSTSIYIFCLRNDKYFIEIKQVITNKL